ncbi:carboxypeptidase regulatory-like domain-containing protein [Hyalangium versicolor]|uniref:carboxypeptidase regulatory-like domain-containing protein n=1 Tax=Hyalangium versicolor TaxID=2861190 RepID=UPI001CCD033C|nr:carboxypeptidase regulatory-like domain-containing protein [Hyalangium versicolor]
MRQRLHIAIVFLLAVGTSSCGELANAPFLFGTVHGQISDCDPSVGYVSVMGEPELNSRLAVDGSFTLEKVPAGQAELFIVASATRALREPLIVQGGQSVTLGALVPKEASYLSVWLKSPEHQDVSEAQVTVKGTPVQELPVSEDGWLKVGPLPDGCFSLNISAPGFPAVDSDTCVSAGEQKEVEVHLPPPHSGCAMTGCSDDYQCAQTGHCVECLEDVHCGAGFVCLGSQCEATAVCVPCDGGTKCHGNAICQALPGGGSACLEKCNKDKQCGSGFVCQESRCTPNPTHFAGCGAYESVGATCTSDNACVALGIINGICREQSCTFACTTNEECPDKFVCKALGDGNFCQPGK